MSSKLISIIIPAYNEAENIPVICTKLDQVFAVLDYDVQIIFVADGCTDSTMEVLKFMASRSDNIYFIEFSRNFGHQMALKAGIDHAGGNCVISMDCDLQHPPELIPEMISKWEEGFEVVYTIRKEDMSLPLKKRFSSRIFYKTLNTLSDVELESGAADFRLLDRKVVDVIKHFHENDPFLRGLIKWIGFKQTSIEYKPAQRFSGSSKYDLRKMLRFALQGVTSFSVKPLYGAIYLGFGFSGLSLIYIPYVITAYFRGEQVEGWASTIMTIVFFGGLQLIILGIIGVYIGKMFMQIKDRPNYIIRSTNLSLSGDTSQL